MSQDTKKFDLVERTAKFGESVVKFCKKIPRGPITDPLINQLVKCGTSVGQTIPKQMMQRVNKILNIR